MIGRGWRTHSREPIGVVRTFLSRSVQSGRIKRVARRTYAANDVMVATAPTRPDAVPFSIRSTAPRSQASRRRKPMGGGRSGPQVISRVAIGAAAPIRSRTLHRRGLHYAPLPTPTHRGRRPRPRRSRSASTQTMLTRTGKNAESLNDFACPGGPRGDAPSPLAHRADPGSERRW